MKNIEALTIGEVMVLQTIISTYKDNENKLYEEMVKFIYGNTDVPKKEADLALLRINEIINAEEDLSLRFIHKGVEYGFITNLDEMTTAEYVDLDQYLKEGTQWHKIMAVLYRPIVKPKWYMRWLKIFFKDTYQIEKYEGTSKYADIMKEVTHKTYMGAKVFFYRLETSLLEISDIYIQQKVKSLKKKPEQNSN